MNKVYNLKKTQFTLGNDDIVFNGYIEAGPNAWKDGESYETTPCPWFTRSEAERIMTVYTWKWTYEEGLYAFRVYDDLLDEWTTYYGHEYQDGDKTIVLYPIGNRDWEWSEYNY